jgi:hypothetical protein
MAKNQFHAKAHKADECGQSAQAALAAGAPEMSEIVITDKMMAEGMRQFHADRRFENDWEVVARIYAAMREAEIQALK